MKKAPRGRGRTRRGAAHRGGAGQDQERERLRFAVIGQGYFAQSAILPAFAHARESCELTAIFSEDEKKREELRRKHKVPFALPYEELDDFLRSGEVQALYIALPNHLHREYTVRAARAGVHVLCEKPMAVSIEECEEMIAACAESRVKLMIAYRLHFERANMTAVEEIRAGRIGDPRYFLSAFSFELDPDNVRGMPTEEGGGPLYDIGIYCINAARYLFRAEPTEVVAMAAHRPDKPGLGETEEQAAAILRFPEERIASFTVSFGASDVSRYTVVGTKGSLALEPAYSHSADLHLTIKTPRSERRRTFPKTDQIAPELLYFADCVQNDREPEPSGREGLHDVAIIQAILQAARSRVAVTLSLEDREARPAGGEVVEKPPVEKPPLIHAGGPRS